MHGKLEKGSFLSRKMAVTKKQEFSGPRGLWNKILHKILVKKKFGSKNFNERLKRLSIPRVYSRFAHNSPGKLAKKL